VFYSILFPFGLAIGEFFPWLNSTQTEKETGEKECQPNYNIDLPSIRIGKKNYTLILKF
jgi:hypothetical protein